MQSKKSHKANLERKRGVHFITGIVVSLSLILISFEWTRPVNLDKDLAAAPDITDIIDLPDIVPRDEPKPERREQPKVDVVIIPVPEDVDMPDIEWNFELDPTTTVDIWIDDEPEDLPPEQDFYYFPQKRATFNGGPAETEFGKYIYSKLRYPGEAVENGVEGLVVLQFDISPAGELLNVILAKSVHPSLDNEALRVVKSSPRWSPATPTSLMRRTLHPRKRADTAAVRELFQNCG